MTFAPEHGIKFTLTGPNGSIAVFNDSDDPNFVGMLTNITGLDSPEVRESGESLVAFDGGVQGPNYYGRRPIVLEGNCYGHSSAAARNAKLAKLMGACNAMRADAMLTWLPSGHIWPVNVALRLQQPLRIEGAWNKTFQVSMVAADPRVYSTVPQYVLTNVPGETIVPINGGNTESFPTYTLLGPGVAPVIHNTTSGLSIATTATLGFDDAIVVDTLRRTVERGVRVPGGRLNYFVNPIMNSSTQPFTASLLSTTVARVASSGPAVAPPYGGSFVLSSVRTSGSSVHTVRWPITATPATASGDIWTFAFDVLAGGIPANVPMTINISFFNSGNAFIRTDTTTVAAGSISTGAWLRFKGTSLAAPVNAAKVEVQLEVPSPATGTSMWYTGFTMEKADTNGSYFSGTDPILGNLGAWTGAVDNSTSWSYTTAVDTHSDLTPWYSIIDFATTRWSGLVPGNNNLNVTYTGTPGVGVSFRTDWRDAWL